MPGDPNSRGARFAELIRFAREGRGLSQDELATRSGVSRSTIIRWENGRAERPDPDQVGAVCQVLDVAPQDAAATLGYLARGNAVSETGTRFAELIRTTRERRGLSHVDLEGLSGISRSTIGRWERGISDRPEPDHVRAVCAALGIDPREAAVALGYLTREEVSGEALLPPFVEEVLEMLQDPRMPAAEREQWIQYLKYLHDRAIADRSAS